MAAQRGCLDATLIACSVFVRHPDSIARARECVKESFALSVELGGSISGEHGIGYVKAPYLDIAVDRPTLEVMKAIKNTLDPNGILNPGKMFV